MLIFTALDLKRLSFKYLRVVARKMANDSVCLHRITNRNSQLTSAAIKRVAVVKFIDSCFEFLFGFKDTNIAPSDTGSSAVGRVAHRRFFWLSHSVFS